MGTFGLGFPGLTLFSHTHLWANLIRPQLLWANRGEAGGNGRFHRWEADFQEMPDLMEMGTGSQAVVDWSGGGQGLKSVHGGPQP